MKPRHIPVIPTSKLHPFKKQDVVDTTPNTDIANRVEQDVFDMIQKSYAKIGGHEKIRKPSDLRTEYPHSE